MIEQQETAEDLMQETFIKAFLSKNQVEHQDKIHSWLFSIAKNTTIDFIRKQQKFQYEICLNKDWKKLMLFRKINLFKGRESQRYIRQ